MSVVDFIDTLKACDAGFQAVEKVLPAKGFGGKDSWKGNRQGSLSLKSTTF